MTPALRPIAEAEAHPGAPPEQGPDQGSEGIVMTEQVFNGVAAIARREAGLALNPARSGMVRSRLMRRLRALGINDFGVYLAYVSSPDGQEELRQMISALTTNVTNFFRESHHFDTLRDRALPPLMTRAASGGRVRLWSAGCSAGQEPYSMAMTILGLDPDAPNRDIRILASDIDDAILSTARAGIYDRAALEPLDPRQRSTCFHPRPDGMAEVAPALRALVRFRPLNLHAPWPMSQKFDVIFCRNVLIYFDAETQAALLRRFAAALAPEGWLFLGHSERVGPGEQSLFRRDGVTTFRPSNGARF